MPVSLTNFATGAVISASTLNTRLQEVELYINEQIAAGDRSANWLDSNHVYRPDFYGGSNPHTTLVTGESYFRERSIAAERRTFFSYYLGAGPYPVPGLNATIQVPEDIVANNYRLVVAASFYVYEFGGTGNSQDGYGMSESHGAGVRAATLDLLINGTPARSSHQVRHIYKGSRTSTLQIGAFYPRKQISMVWGDISAPTVSVGCNDVGVGVTLLTPPEDSRWKHIIFAQGNLVARYFLR